MAMRYTQGANYSGATRFSQTPLSEVEFSKMVTDPTSYLDFNAGDIVPLKCIEVLPHSTFGIDLDYILRQTSASVRPVMGRLCYDIFAFFVPNRIINESWRNVLGENSSGFWSAPDIELAPLVDIDDELIPNDGIKIPVGSIADYYGFPTQGKIPKNILAQMNDLKAKGYLSVFNNYFRDENYQAPIPFSKLNIYNGFMRNQLPAGNYQFIYTMGKQISDGSYPAGALAKAISGDGSKTEITGMEYQLAGYSFLSKPLKANKYHDPFTSVLPTPQKGAEVFVGFSADAPVRTGEVLSPQYLIGGDKMKWAIANNGNIMAGPNLVGIDADGNTSTAWAENANVIGNNVVPANLYADLSNVAGININELRTAVATQQVLELLARGGSRYWEFLKSFFGVEVENPFPDIPTQLGHFRRELDMYQVAQTAPSSDSPQGSLTAFGYTNKGGSLFTKTFLEHGYIHIFGVVRHMPIYSSYLAPDNFRRNTMDFYLPQLANISEQPVRLSCLNPFRSDSQERAIGYQEAWWEYRMDMDTVAGMMRSQPEGVESLDVWHFGDYFDSDFTHVNGEWLVDKTEEILNRSLSATSELVSQFIGMFNWKITKQLPMPVYSVPGLDQV